MKRKKKSPTPIAVMNMPKKYGTLVVPPVPTENDAATAPAVIMATERAT